MRRDGQVRRISTTRQGGEPQYETSRRAEDRGTTRTAGRGARRMSEANKKRQASKTRATAHDAEADKQPARHIMR